VASDRSQLDSTVEIITPENIAFRYRVAGPYRRLPAYLVDLLLRVVVSLVTMLCLALGFGLIGLEGMGVGIGLVLWFAMAWFYGGLFESYWNGQTPGKRMLGIRVVSTDGQPITALQAILRNVLRSLDALPLAPWPIMDQAPAILPTYLVGLVAPLLNDRYQRIGDLFCGTLVVLEERQRLYGVARVTDPDAIELARSLPPSFVLGRSLARALSNYVERRAGFAWARRHEVARHLGEPLRIKLGLPAQTNHDTLLCALYHRTFITDRMEGGDDSRSRGSPFGRQAPVPVAPTVEKTPEQFWDFLPLN